MTEKRLADAEEKPYSAHPTIASFAAALERWIFNPLLYENKSILVIPLIDIDCAMLITSFWPLSAGLFDFDFAICGRNS